MEIIINSVSQLLMFRFSLGQFVHGGQGGCRDSCGMSFEHSRSLIALFQISHRLRGIKQGRKLFRLRPHCAFQVLFPFLWIILDQELLHFFLQLLNVQILILHCILYFIHLTQKLISISSSLRSIRLGKLLVKIHQHLASLVSARTACFFESHVGRVFRLGS